MKYHIANPEASAHVQHIIRNLDSEKVWIVEIKKKTKARSLSQNALYWRWMNEIASLVSDHTGYEKDEVHELFKKQFLEPKEVEIGGMGIYIYSTKNLTTKQMADYMDRIDRFCISELGIGLPIPEEMQLR